MQYRLLEFLHKYLTIIRRFYEKYPGDGGCNEGPSYWAHSVGKYMQHLDMIDHRLHLGGKMFRDEKLRRMCEYPAGSTVPCSCRWHGVWKVLHWGGPVNWIII